MAISMTEKKESEETKTEIALTRKKSAAINKSARTPAPTSALTSDLWQAFDDTFAKFRTDVEDLFFPARWTEEFSFIPQARVPVVDLEDREKEYVVKAEMPGFKKEDIELEVQEDSIQITGTAGWKYDEKGKLYICKERACKTFYRRIELPEEVKIHEVQANLSEGVLEIVIPKKTPKPKRKIQPK